MGGWLGKALSAGDLQSRYLFAVQCAGLWLAGCVVPDNCRRISDCQSCWTVHIGIWRVSSRSHAVGANSLQSLKQIFETVLAEQNSSFKQAGLIEYPRKGIWSIVFIATETKGEVDKLLPDNETIAVFLPTTPNPTSGFLLFVPRKDIHYLEMSVEEAAKIGHLGWACCPRISQATEE